jgi:hypothetical protein
MRSRCGSRARWGVRPIRGPHRHSLSSNFDKAMLVSLCIELYSSMLVGVGLLTWRCWQRLSTCNPSHLRRTCPGLFALLRRISGRVFCLLVHACISQIWNIGSVRHRSALLITAWGCDCCALSGDECSRCQHKWQSSVNETHFRETNRGRWIEKLWDKLNFDGQVRSDVEVKRPTEGLSR